MIIQFGSDQKQHYSGLIDCLRQLYPFPDNYVLIEEDAEEYILTKDVFIYLIDDKVVGTASAITDMKLGHENALAVQIEDVAVLPTMQGKGIGKALVNHIVQKYKRQAYKIILYCSQENEEFYHKCGFYNAACVLMRMDVNEFTD